VYNLRPGTSRGDKPLFETLEPKPADAILKLIAEHQNDVRTDKVDLGVGVYRDAEGRTPVLTSVKKAERWLLENQQSKAYLGSRGDIVYCDAIQSLIFADKNDVDRIATIQTPGGSGALRVAAELILRANPGARMWVSDPTWNNHAPLLGGAGIRLVEYPYYDVSANSLRFDAMMTALGKAKSGDILLLHACCHNPTGMDLSEAEWREVADLVVGKQLVPFVDMAYQGFASDLNADAFGVRHLAGRVPQMIVAHSCSKNFGLYRDRVGAVSFVAPDARSTKTVDSQALNVVRTMYSVPPDHGGAVVAHILNDRSLRKEWLGELVQMRERLKDMRALLVDALARAASGRDFSHIGRTTGMFCYLGITPEQVARLKSDHGVYLVDSSRINVCGITAGNVDYLAKSIAAVL
jgi:aspartate/tyrosine/aromatic aminotransferase